MSDIEQERNAMALATARYFLTDRGKDFASFVLQDGLDALHLTDFFRENGLAAHVEERIDGNYIVFCKRANA